MFDHAQEFHFCCCHNNPKALKQKFGTEKLGAGIIPEQ